MAIFGLTEPDIYTTIHSYAKIYPNMTKVFEYDKPIRVRKKGYESRDSSMSVIKNKRKNQSIRTQYDSIRRTKTRLRDCVISNNFDLFCTFTFAKDRQNIDKCKARMSRWLAHANERVGKFAYIIVPEFHKDGKSIHFHALFKGYRGELVDSGHKRPGGRVVYNIKGYKHGFSTATRIDSSGGPLVASYVTKYITKDMPQFANKRRYWCSHNLTRPRKIENPIIDPWTDRDFTKPHQANGFSVRTAHKSLDLLPDNRQPYI